MTHLNRYVKYAAPLMMVTMLALLAACSSLIGPRQVELPQERMQQNLDCKFPLHHRVLGIFEVELSHPQLAILAEKTGKDPVEALEESIKILTPALEVRSRRVGGATYQVPVEVPARRARTLAVRWLVEHARARREKQMSLRLANELLDAQSQQGGAYKRKDDIFRMAQANKPFAHYRW